MTTSGTEAKTAANWWDVTVGPTAAPEGVRFSQIVFGVRLATTAIAMVLVATSPGAHHVATYVWAIIVIGYNLFRLIQPLRSQDDFASQVRVIVEVALHALAVTFTGAWTSPFVYPLLTAIIVAGFARGIGPAVRIGVATAAAVSFALSVERGYTGNRWLIDAQWSLFLMLVAVMAGYAKRILGEASKTHELTMSYVEQLSDANELLSSLHHVAQVLPASLDLEEALESMMVRLGELFDFDAGALLFIDQTDGAMEVARWNGHRLPHSLRTADLPIAVQRVLVERSVTFVPNLLDLGGGLAPRRVTGLYGAMIARESLVGVVVMESSTPGAFDNRDVDLLRGFLEPAALAIDNARVFSRLRTVGADEERTRIARDLHDRIGQSLAYIGFELDRLIKTHDKGNEVGPSLKQLRVDVRGVVAEVRDTLYDLRTDVSEEKDFAETMETFLTRVRERSNLRTSVIAQVDGRLALLPERELWRIAQEAVINVERHAKATAVSVTWRTDGNQALLEVIDDGIGFPTGKSGRLDSYGIVGMRERAASIGATMEISGIEGRGTVVRCRLDAA